MHVRSRQTNVAKAGYFELGPVIRVFRNILPSKVFKIGIRVKAVVHVLVIFKIGPSVAVDTVGS